MSGRPIDFQSMIDLDYKIVDHLEQFLQEKESRVAQQVSNLGTAFINEVINTQAPVLPMGNLFKLSEAVENFGRQVRLSSKKDTKDQQVEEVYQQLSRDFNLVLWKYVEVLESCSIELFQQIQRVSINRWHLSILQVVQKIKDLLNHRIEDSLWAIKRLEKILKEYLQKHLTSSHTWKKWLLFNTRYLDHSLIRNLEQTEKFLQSKDQQFKQKYADYLLLNVKVEESVERMKNYPILALLDLNDQNLYVDVFRLLKMINLNKRNKKELTYEAVKALKSLTSSDHIKQVMQIYYRDLKAACFSSSFEWKSFNQDEENFTEVKDKLNLKIKNYQQELHQLINTISLYRTFILKNDPNPYIGSRLGFSEWTVGPEPQQAKALKELIYEAEELEGYYSQLLQSIEYKNQKQNAIEYHAQQEIETLLHEMGQPLISQTMMRNRAGYLLEQLKACNELGSPYLSTVFYIDEVFSKMMREDWKYHVLHEFPLFHQMYHLHQGISKYRKDPSHTFRVEKFRSLFDKIEKWVNKKTLHTHIREIELDINDMKTYLQDFLASLQRLVKDKSQDPFLDETVHRFRQQLLEYRYLFGQFFLNMTNKGKEGVQLRNQFLYVDQYLDSAENLLAEIKMSWQGRR